MARPTLMTHRKFHRLVRSLGSRLIARGALEILWDYCYEAGTDYIGTSEDVEAIVGWTGEPGQLTAAFVNAGGPGRGFIEPVVSATDPPVYQVHDLWHHAPDYVGKRRKRELARLDRVDPALLDHCPPNGGHDPLTPDCQIEVDGTRAPARAPALAPAHAQETDSPVLGVFPTVGQGGTVWRLRRAQVDEWQAAFPNLDVLAECRKALAWINANPGRRKTVRGMPKFLVSWLSRAVDSGRGRQPSWTPAPLPPSARDDWFVECQRLHNGRCGGSMKHAVRMDIDAQKKAAAS